MAKYPFKLESRTSGAVYEFVGPTRGILVKLGDYPSSIGRVSTGLFHHDDENHWKPVENIIDLTEIYTPEEG